MIVNTYNINNQVVNGNPTSSGTILSIEKDIELRQTSSGTMLSIEKQIDTTAGPVSILSITKNIVASGPAASFYVNNGWEPQIVLGSWTIPKDILTGTISVIKEEDDNHTAEFTIILEPDVYDLYDYQGKAVTITVRTPSIIKRLFTGFVDIPVLNTFEEKLTLKCVADRRKLIGALYYAEPYIGYYHTAILGSNLSTLDKITARLSTIPSSLDFDGDNIYTLTSWTPKASPDFSYGSSDVYRKDPQLTIESSGKIVNYISIQLEYGYQRLHQREATFGWRHPYAPESTGLGNICPFLQDAPSMPTRELIRGAAAGGGWYVDTDSIYFGPQFLSGSYYCDGRWVQWSTIETSYLNAPVTDSNGNPVYDPSGNPIMRSVQTQVADNTTLFTMEASWVGKMRFNQNIRESYSLVVRAPKSITLYGTLSGSESYGMTSSQQYPGWSTYTGVEGPPSGARLVTTSTARFYEGDLDRADFNKAYVCALNKAKSEILKSHRDTTIVFQRELTPEVELKHTVQLTGKWIRGKGKCKRIVHTMNVSDGPGGIGGEAYTEFTLAQYRGVGSTTETSLVPITPPYDNTVPPQAGCYLGTHLGEDPDSLGASTWTGYVGNKAVTKTIPNPDPFKGATLDISRTTYQESFIVKTPDVPNAARDEKINSASATYNINIPTDDTEYESYG